MRERIHIRSTPCDLEAASNPSRTLTHAKLALLALAALALALVVAGCAASPSPTPSECVTVQNGVLVNSACDLPGVTPEPELPSVPVSSSSTACTEPAGCVVFTRVGGCGTCHTIAGVSSANTAPVLSDVGARLTVEEIRQSILEPNAVIADPASCEAAPCEPDLMPQNFGETLTAEQIDDLVEYLSSLQ